MGIIFKLYYAPLQHDAWILLKSSEVFLELTKYNTKGVVWHYIWINKGSKY